MLIKNTTILNEYFEIEKNIDIYIQKEWIKAIGSHLNVIDDEIIDGSNLLIMPGLIDAHTHCGQQLLKGRVLDSKGLIWQEVMLPFESTLDKDTMELNASLCALEMIKNGTTSFMDAGSYQMDAACNIFKKSGLRGYVTRSTMDDPSLPESIRESSAQAVDKNDKLYEQFHDKERLSITYSLRSLLSVSDTLIDGVRDHAKARNALIQAHMNEYEKEVLTIKERTGLWPYEYLERKGILSHNFIGSHSLLLHENEYELIKKHKIVLVHCPFSNSGKVLANLPKLEAYDISVALGSDGVAHGGLSLFQEMRNYRCMMKVHYFDQVDVGAKKLLHMATINGAKALHNDKLGKLKAGYFADLIALDLNEISFAASQDLVHTIVESAGAQSITHSMVHGKWLMKDRIIQTLNEKAILQKAKERIRP